MTFIHKYDVLPSCVDDTNSGRTRSVGQQPWFSTPVSSITQLNNIPCYCWGWRDTTTSTPSTPLEITARTLMPKNLIIVLTTLFSCFQVKAELVKPKIIIKRSLRYVFHCIRVKFSFITTWLTKKSPEKRSN